MPLYLVPTERDDGPVPVDRPILFFGRHTDCDVIITCSRRVSRRHCCVAQVGDGYLVRDLGSMNGVRVNGTRVQTQTSMKLGDELSVGDVRFVLKEGRYDVPKGRVTIGPPLDENGEPMPEAARSESPGKRDRPRSSGRSTPDAEQKRKRKSLSDDAAKPKRKPARPPREFSNPESEEIFLQDAAAAAPERGSMEIVPTGPAPIRDTDKESDVYVSGDSDAEPDVVDPPADDPSVAAPSVAAPSPKPAPRPASSEEIFEIRSFDLLD